jgi:hypothetical protein
LTKPEATGIAGGGGSVQVQANTVPSIQLEIQGRTLYLLGAKLLSQTMGGAGTRDGVLGIDAMAGGFPSIFEQCSSHRSKTRASRADPT